MNELQIFKNPEFGQVRALNINGEPWLVGKDIAESLKYKEPHKAIVRHVEEDDRMKYPVADSLGRKQETWLVNESGLYSLILSSELKEAKNFKKWVTSEVLPSIRKYGIYATDEVIDRILDNPDFGIKLLQELKIERQKRIEAEQMNNILMHVNKTYTATEIAKELGFKSAIALNNDLAKKRIQFKQNGTWVLYSDYANKGYVEIKQEVLDNGKVIYHRRWTQLGREFLLKLYNNKLVEEEVAN